MREVELQPWHVQFVLDHLWPRGVEELRQLGTTHGEAYDRFMAYARDGVFAHTLLFDGVPVVVYGVATDEHGPFTWFQATDAFDQHALAITRRIRKVAATFDKLSIYSVCVHPDTARWFGALGFKLNQQYAAQLPSGATLRRFDRT